MLTILYFITIIEEKKMKWILILIMVGLVGLIAYKPITDIIKEFGWKF
jgi:hypothetical protein